MKNSMEAIWKEGFLSEKNLVVPKINNLYNQKSIHVVDSVKRMFRINLTVIVITAIMAPLVYYWLDALWQGAAASILLLLTAGYSNRQMAGLKTLDQGATSLEYLRSFDRWLKDVFARNEKIVRLSYPLYFLIAASTIVSTWSKQEVLVLKTQQRFPDLLFIGNVPVVALIVVVVATLLMLLFSGKIYKWDVRLLYGRVVGKLEETIAEMEKLTQG